MVKFISSALVLVIASAIQSVASPLAVGLQVGAMPARRHYQEVNPNYHPHPQRKPAYATRPPGGYHTTGYQKAPPPQYQTTGYQSSPAPQGWKQDMLNQLNQLRAQYGRGPLRLDQRLNTMAERHSNYQASINDMTHQDVAGTLGDRCSQVGIDWSNVAENVAWNYPDVSAVMVGWKNSPGHFENMMGDYNIVGFGETNKYWTQDFAKV